MRWTPLWRLFRSLFDTYGAELSGDSYKGLGIVNYISSHDDMKPFDPTRERPFESATRLMLSPGSVQIYYGDEVGRPLVVAGATGDANMRSMFDWQTLDDPRTQRLLGHWQKLGRFRHEHAAIGAGVHRTLSTSPLVFQRTLDEGSVHDSVVVALGVPPGALRIPVGTAFRSGERVCDAYGGGTSIVTAGHVEFQNVRDIVLLGACP
jgi:alpha-amylase